MYGAVAEWVKLVAFEALQATSRVDVRFLAWVTLRMGISLWG